MATVTSFEALANPTRIELKQFAELFRPLFDHSSPEARRQAVAALARLSTLPESVCFFIGSQPIGTAALFLAQSPAISDQTLIDIARSQGAAHARAIATREDLSPTVVDALAALHNGNGYRKPKAEQTAEQPAVTTPEPPVATPVMADAPAPEPVTAEAPRPKSRIADAREKARLAREEALRNELKLLVGQMADPDAPAPILLRAADETQAALMVRFARQRQMPLFSRVLAEALGTTTALSDRIMLDVSGVQLATTLIALGCRAADIRLVLTAIYPHLAQITEGRNRAFHLVRSLDPSECVARVLAWRRADSYTQSGTFEDDTSPAAVNGNDGAAPQDTAARR